MSNWPFELVPAPAPGTKVAGAVDWNDPVLVGWEWPYVAVNGASPGPAVLITAGIHGSEYPSIDSVVRLGASLDPKLVRGQVLCLPIMNPAAFWERTAYVSPIDNLNLNRVFPGKPKGSFSERLAHHFVQRAIRHASAYIDLHGGDLSEGLTPFGMYYETGDSKVDEKSRSMVDAFGSPAQLVLRREGAPISGLAYVTAATLGIPAMIAEDGGAGQYDSDIAIRMAGGLENVLRSVGALEGPVRNFPPPRRFDRFVWVHAREAGFFRANVKVGAELIEGQKLGTLVNFHGQPLEDVIAPAKGQLLFMMTSPAIGKKGLICGIGA